MEIDTRFEQTKSRKKLPTRVDSNVFRILIHLFKYSIGKKKGDLKRGNQFFYRKYLSRLWKIRPHPLPDLRGVINWLFSCLEKKNQPPSPFCNIVGCKNVGV